VSLRIIAQGDRGRWPTLLWDWVTCLYRGCRQFRPPVRPWVRGLEALGIQHRLCAGRSEREVSREWTALRIGLNAGVSPAVTSEPSGGFEALLDYLADDYELRPAYRIDGKASRAQRRDRRPPFCLPTRLGAGRKVATGSAALSSTRFPIDAITPGRVRSRRLDSPAMLRKAADGSEGHGRRKRPGV